MTYLTDLTDDQWSVIEPLLPKAKPGGRPRTTNLRRTVDAVLYLVKSGCHWRLLPTDFPPWRTVYEYFVSWRADGTLRRIQQRLVQKVRRKEKRSAFPTIAILDSQSVKTGKMASEEKGYDGGKHVKGRKRHLAVDVLGMLIGVSVTSANTHDTKGGKRVICRIKRWLKDKSPRLVLADGGYAGQPFKDFVRKTINATVRIKKGLGRNALKKVKGFVPVAKRWVVERSLSWLGDYRRLDKDQERLIRNSVAMIRLASISMMLRRLFPSPHVPVW